MESVIKKIWCLFLSVSLIVSCVPNQGSVKSNISDKMSTPTTTDTMSNVSVSNVEIVNHQLIITGRNFTNVKKVKVEGPYLNEIFSIESISSSRIVANALKAMSFGVNGMFGVQGVFNLILSDAGAAATFAISFTLQDRSVTANKLNSMGAQSGQVLKYNGSTWIPSNLSNSQLYLGNFDATNGLIIGGVNDGQPLGAANAGDYYIVTVAGTYTGITYPTNSWIIYNGATWEKITPADSVISFNGRKNIVVPLADDYSLDMLSDVDLATNAPLNNQVLTYDTSGATPQWVPKTPAILSVSATGSGLQASISGTNTDVSFASQTGKYILAAPTDGGVPTFRAFLLSDLPATTAGHQVLIGPTGAGGAVTSRALDITDLPNMTNYALGATTKESVLINDPIPLAFGKVQRFLNDLNADYVALRSGVTSTVLGSIDMTGATSHLYLATPPLVGAVVTEAANVQYVTNAIAANGVWDKISSSAINYSAGNVGIGTITPATPLNIKDISIGGSANAYQIQLDRYNGNVGNAPIASGIRFNSMRGASGASAVAVNGDELGTLDFGSSDSASTVAEGAIIKGVASGTWSNGIHPTDLVFYTSPNSNSLPIENMRLKNTGDLDLLGTIRAARLIGDGSGIYGITGASGGVSNIAETMIAADSDASGTGADTGAISFSTRGVARAIITNAGAMGIGTPTPGSALDVKGELRLSGSTSGYIGFNPGVSPASTTYTLPATPGAIGQVLTTNGVATNTALSWSMPVTSMFGRTGAVVAAAGDYTATQITNTAAGNIAAITVQAALNELDTKKQAAFTASAGLAAALSDETGTGAAVFSISPALTGVPTAPTAAPVTDSTQIATTAFVKGQVGANITNLGTITSGVWNGTAIDIAHGGTGAATAPLARDALGLTKGALSTNIPILGASGIVGTNLCAGDNAGAIICTAMNSSIVSGGVSDETGSGALVFGTAPTISDPVIANISPAANFTLTQSAVAPFTSVSAGAISNTLYLKAGKVGIGTTNPIASLEVDANTDGAMNAFFMTKVGAETPGLSIYNYSSTYAPFPYLQKTAMIYAPGGAPYNTENLELAAANVNGNIRFHTAGFSTTATERMRITNTGNVGIGTASPVTRAHISSLNAIAGGGTTSSLLVEGTFADSAISIKSADILSRAYMTFLQGVNGKMEMGITPIGDAAGAGVFYMNPTVQAGSTGSALAILQDGRVGIGLTGPNYKLDVAGDINTSTCFRIGATTVSGSCTSDARLKKNIQDFNQGLKELLGIRLRTYQFNGLGEMPKTGETAVGVIAQEVEKTNPSLVKTRKILMHPDDQEKTEIKVVDYSKFSYMLINAVKELYGDIKSIMTRVLSLEGKDAAKDRAIASVNAKAVKLEAENVAKDKEIKELKIKAMKAEQENAAIKARMDKIEQMLLKK